ncbi:MAG: phenylalanine--tRNA ligase subunit beta [Prolixibacteraceae bacterium]|nr:phenylalanine--tRNA ligase subunit beta [Prolixibacteraceae bacterium]
MKISYSWLKDYIKFDNSPEEICEILTQTGLEVAGIEEVESVKGGMKGIVIGKVITCEKHPDSDHLSKATVDIGQDRLLNIVCGAPNVAAGQKVVVAPAGTVLYPGGEKLVLKKTKIRGELSEGMICAEDEIGIGTDHEGIIVLNDSAVIGSDAKDYFNVNTDYAIEIDITPNRIDGASHIGVARDLAAFMNIEKSVEYVRPSTDKFKTDDHELMIDVVIDNPEACYRYTGVSMTGVEVKPSPQWLQDRLKVIGLNPVNNIVDITNYVLFETGQPLHAFDAKDITGNKIIVKTLAAGTRFITLDKIERTLDEEDLMICNSEEPMGIAGVFGGLGSGIKTTTKNIFIESAWFNPVYVRKTARRHGLSTDASFRFERGIDPESVLYALKRAAVLIKDCAGGSISSEIVDVYPNPAEYFKVNVTYQNIDRLIGKNIDKKLIKKILESLEIKIENEDDKSLSLLVPPYRVDVTREADVIEEILRIYGYNNVEIPTQVKASLQYPEEKDSDIIRNVIANMLTSLGFNEIWSNSLTKSEYYERSEDFSKERSVKLLNPLSSDLNCLRQSLLYGGLECVSYNINRQNRDLKLYEFGNCYAMDNNGSNEKLVGNYLEEEHLGIFITGNREAENWTGKPEPVSFFYIKAIAENIFKKLGINIDKLTINEIVTESIPEGLVYSSGNKILLETGYISDVLMKKFEIDSPVCFADFHLGAIMKIHIKNEVLFNGLPKFPIVRRDLALLIDKEIKFKQIKELAFRTERNILQEVGLFDVYEGKGIAPGKKSYAVSFLLRDDKRTLNDKQIDKTMKKIFTAFERELGAQLR